VKKLILIWFATFVSAQSYAIEITHEMGVSTFEQSPKKVIALDWALTETVLSLGVELEGVTNPQGYQQWVAKPELSPQVTDVGSRREPNLELLSELKPDVILISKHMAAAYPQLNQIAPVLVFTIYSEKKQPLKSAESITRSLGQLFNKQQQAELLISQTHQRLAENGRKIEAASSSQKPVIFARFINDKTLRVHSKGSLAQDTIAAMGMRNDWKETTNMWGFTTTGVEKLAEHQGASVILFGPLEEKERKQLNQSPLWQAMEFTRSNSVYELPAIWTFGGLIAAQRFSDHITQQLVNKP